MREDIIKKELDKEIYFKDPAEEYRYFEEIIKKIKERGDNRLKRNLINRYIKALASFKDEYEADAFIQVYKDCLIMLGIDDYSIDKRVEYYKSKHKINSDNQLVSEEEVVFRK